MGHRFDLWSGKIPHALEQLSPQLLKPVRLELVLCNRRSHHNEKPTYLNYRVAAAHHTSRKPKCSKEGFAFNVDLSIPNLIQ